MGEQCNVLITPHAIVYWDAHRYDVHAVTSEAVKDGMLQRIAALEPCFKALQANGQTRERLVFIVQSSTFFRWQDKVPPVTDKQLRHILKRQHDRLLGKQQADYTLYYQVTKGVSQQQLTSIGIPCRLTQHYRQLATSLGVKKCDVIPYDVWLGTQHPTLPIHLLNQYKRIGRGDEVALEVRSEWGAYVQQALKQPCAPLGKKLSNKGMGRLRAYRQMSLYKRLLVACLSSLVSGVLYAHINDTLAKRDQAITQALADYTVEQAVYTEAEAANERQQTFATCQDAIQRQNEAFMRQYQCVRRVASQMPSLYTAYGVDTMTEGWVKGRVSCAYDLVGYMRQLDTALPHDTLLWDVGSKERLVPTDFTVYIEGVYDEE